MLLLLAEPHAARAAPVDAADTPRGSGARLAFLGFLQVTAAVLNLLPVPGLDGYAIIEPYLDPETRGSATRSSRGACSA